MQTENSENFDFEAAVDAEVQRIRDAAIPTPQERAAALVARVVRFALPGGSGYPDWYFQSEIQTVVRQACGEIARMLSECKPQGTIDEAARDLSSRLSSRLADARRRGGMLYAPSAADQLQDNKFALDRYAWTNGHTMSALQLYIEKEFANGEKIVSVDWAVITTSTGRRITRDQLIEFTQPRDVSLAAWRRHFDLGRVIDKITEAQRQEWSEHGPSATGITGEDGVFRPFHGEER